MTYLAGLGLSLSLIVAIGAQNVFVLRQGLRREHLLMVVAVCAASDALLIALGVSGIGLALVGLPWLVTAVRWAGVMFLLAYGVVAARRAWRPKGDSLEADGRAGSERDRGATHSRRPEGSLPDALDSSGRMASPTAAAPRATAVVERSGASSASRRGVLAAVLAVTWLNPHVYLDTVFLMGAVASSHGDARWIFAAGAMTGSVVWFSALGGGARLLAAPLARPGAWRVVDAAVAVVMVGLALTLALGS